MRVLLWTVVVVVAAVVVVVAAAAGADTGVGVGANADANAEVGPESMVGDIGRKTPQGVHLSFGNSPSSYLVVWLTEDATESTVLEWGTSEGSLGQTSSGSARSYDSVGGGYNHVVEFDTGGVVDVGQRVWYKVGSPSDGGMSETFSFVHRRGGGRPSEAWKFGMFGDLGYAVGHPTIGRVVQHAAAEWDTIVHAGDISYANDDPFRYETIWKEWMEAMEPAAASVPYQVAPGNHESNCRNPLCVVQTANFTTYKYKYEMPNVASGSKTNMFYSYDYKNVHFVAISTETDYPGRPIDFLAYAAGAYDHTDQYWQLNWLEQDLAAAAANRDAVPWIVVFGHRPIYTSGSEYVKDNSTVVNTAEYLRKWLEPLFHKYGVDFYLAGHQHSYRRMYPVYAEALVGGTSYAPARATTYLISGAAGNAEGHDSASHPSKWTAFQNFDDYGYSVFEIVNDTTAHVSWYTSVDDTLADSFTVVRER